VFVLLLFEPGDDATEPVITAPFGQLGRDAVGARRGQRGPDRPTHDDQEHRDRDHRQPTDPPEDRASREELHGAVEQWHDSMLAARSGKILGRRRRQFDHLLSINCEYRVTSTHRPTETVEVDGPEVSSDRTFPRITQRTPTTFRVRLITH
jgi:hypothetical protein